MKDIDVCHLIEDEIASCPRKVNARSKKDKRGRKLLGLVFPK